MRIFLVDDHEAASARVRIAVTRPEIALLDVRLPDGSAINVCRDVRSQDPEIRCLILTGYDDDEALAGASG